MIARNSSFAYKGRPVDTKLVGRELSVRYIVEGSIRTSGNQLRVAVRLIDAECGYQLWSEPYDRKLADVFAVQDEITRAIISVLPGRLEDAGRDIAIRKQTSNMTAYDLVLLGNEQWRRLNRSALAAAREQFRAAATLDPNYARAHANAGRRHRNAIEALKQARSLHCWSHGLLAACYAQIGMREEARSELRRFIRERYLELQETGEPAPINELDLARGHNEHALI